MNFLESLTLSFFNIIDSVIIFLTNLEEVIWVRGGMNLINLLINLYILFQAKKIIWSDYKQQAVNKVYSDFYIMIDYIDAIISNPQLYETEGYYPDKIAEFIPQNPQKSLDRPYHLIFNKMKLLEQYQHLYPVQNDATINTYLSQAILIEHQMLSILQQKETKTISQESYMSRIKQLSQQLHTIIKDFKKYLDGQNLNEK